MNNVVYLFKCIDCTVIVKGKINSIMVDACKKTAIVFDSLVSSIEFVNSQSVQMQVRTELSLSFFLSFLDKPTILKLLMEVIARMKNTSERILIPNCQSHQRTPLLKSSLLFITRSRCPFIQYITLVLQSYHRH